MFLLITAISPPDVNDFTNGNLFEIVEKFIDFIFAFLGNLVSALIQFYDTINEANDYLNMLIDGVSSGKVEGLPLLQIIGGYRYLVTDPIFYFTYMMVLLGCLFTIYQLILLLIATFRKFKESLGSGSTKEGFLSGLTKLFKL